MKMYGNWTLVTDVYGAIKITDLDSVEYATILLDKFRAELSANKPPAKKG